MKPSTSRAGIWLAKDPHGSGLSASYGVLVRREMALVEVPELSGGS